MNQIEAAFNKNVQEKILTTVEKLEQKLATAKEALVEIKNYNTLSHQELRDRCLDLAGVLYEGKYQLQKAKERIHKTRQDDKLVVWGFNAVANLADTIDAKKAEIEASLRGE